MKELMLVLFVLGAAVNVAAADENWKNVPIVDTMCAAKVKGDPDKHQTKCALQCEKSGFGILTAEGSFLKLDHAGNQRVVALLNSTKKPDYLRVTLTGERQGDIIKVSTLVLE